MFYFVLRGFNFGLKSAPLHLGTALNPLVDLVRKLFLVPCGRFYDDVSTCVRIVLRPSCASISSSRLLVFPSLRRSMSGAKGPTLFLES